MTLNDKTPGPDSTSKQRARLKMIGVLVLLLGVGSAGIVYWMGTRAPDYSDDLSMVGYNRAEARQMGRLYGQSGLMIEDLSNNLKRPGIQATIIAVVATLFGSGCFYLARFSENDNEPR
jgi:flagellar basal body-associated protein FliL